MAAKPKASFKSSSKSRSLYRGSPLSARWDEEFMTHLLQVYCINRNLFDCDLRVEKIQKNIKSTKPVSTDLSLSKTSITDPLKSVKHVDTSRSKFSMPRSSIDATKSQFVLQAVHQGDHLVEVKLMNNFCIPSLFFKLLGTIIHFYERLSSIVINKGIDNQGLCELSKLLDISNITDLCFDGICGLELHFSLLLSRATHLRHLSLARCKIGDAGTKEICKKLKHPEPASKTLRLLNLSTNGITDVGAEAISEVLRTNRTLVYLNLASNSIEDDGGIAIVRNLAAFALTEDEVFSSKLRKLAHRRRIDKLTQVILSKPRRTSTGRLQGPRRSTFESVAQVANPEKAYELARNLAIQQHGAFTDPFIEDEGMFKSDDEYYCRGNFVLSSLNLAYNNITERTVRMVVAVLQEQRYLPTRLVGLLNVIIEGNFLPDASSYYTAINEHLDQRRFAYMQKTHRPSSKFASTKSRLSV